MVLITPKTKVGELLDQWPELEQVLVALSPAFEKLKHPVLRRTVGRVATLQQAAAIGQLPVDDLVRNLREAVGQHGTEAGSEAHSYLVAAPPEWFSESRVVRIYDASSLIQKGESPLAGVLSAAHQLQGDEILELQAPFEPVPLLDQLKEKGYLVFARQGDLQVVCYIMKA